MAVVCILAVLVCHSVLVEVVLRDRLDCSFNQAILCYDLIL